MVSAQSTWEGLERCAHEYDPDELERHRHDAAKRLHAELDKANAELGFLALAVLMAVAGFRGNRGPYES